MLRLKHLLFWVGTLPILAVQSLLGQTVQVGTCEPQLQSFSTISAAVSGVPSGSTILVCPGTYAEQVTITQAVNLEGATVGTANQALITVPSGGLLANTTSMFGEQVAAQILVLGASPVNISNIAVDGTGSNLGCGVSNIWVAGIFYGSSSSGTVKGVRASGQVDGNCGVGIWAENSDSGSQTVTIQDSTVYNVDSTGIFLASGATPTLSVEVDNNVVTASAALAAIDCESVNGEVMTNDLSNTTFGVLDNASVVNVASNSILGTTYGIFLENGGTAASNRISGSSSIGIWLGAAGATINGNRVMTSGTEGVELSCLAASVTGNLINDAPLGIDQAPAGIGANTFANTATTTTGCALAAAAARRSPARGKLAKSRGQWHTPATPFGTRRK
jgi:nitrous oxidase accessory protein NosD